MQNDPRSQSSVRPDGFGRKTQTAPDTSLRNGVAANRTLATAQGTQSTLSAQAASDFVVSAGAGTLIPAKKQSFWRTFLAIFTGNTRMTVGFCIIAFFVLMAVVGPLLTPLGPNVSTNDLSQAPSLHHLLGTTQEGYDIFSRLVNGARLSLLTSFTAAFGATIIAMVIGMLAGYCGGWVDDLLSLFTNVFLILPGMPLAIVIASFAVHGTWTIIIVLLITGWAWGARVLRAQTLSMRQREFVSSARTTGEGLGRIVFFEILPNEIAIVASSFVGTFIYAALTEVALEYLGLGDTNVASWGTILYWAQTHNALLAGHWWEFIPAGLCVAVLCAGLSCVNFGIDALANPVLRIESRQRKNKKAVA